MMDELKEVKRVLNPTEVLLVVDAMTGQEAAGTSTLVKHANDQVHKIFLSHNLKILSSL